MFRFKSIVLFSSLLFSFFCYSQISENGTPKSWDNIISDNVNVYNSNLNIISKKGVIVDDQIKGESFTFAQSFSINKNSQDNGTWTTLDDGSKIWRLGIKSVGAYSINFTFDNFNVPKGAKVFVYNKDKTQLIGAFTENNINKSNILPVVPVSGDEIIIEYNEPANSEFEGFLSIGNAGHDYLGVFANKDGQFGVSGNCNIDINCIEGASWQVEKKSVCRMVINNTELCTGVLLNNTLNNEKPYILTANHCIETQQLAENTVVVFNYESSNCNGSDGSVSQSVSGSNLRATKNSDSRGFIDFTLIELTSSIPSDYKPYYSGWDARDYIPTNTTGIHHPWGDVKKISKDYNSPVRAISYPGYGYDDNVFWKIESWDDGTTEAGSSGSPLFDNNKRVIGSLSGGFASCTNLTGSDYYLMFSASYNRYSNANEQLKAWLNPESSNLLYLDGYDPLVGIIDENSDGGFSISPNPASDVVEFVCNDSMFLNSELRVFDCLGKLKYAKKVTDMVYYIDISNWTSGIYLINIGGISKKLLVE